MTKDDKIKQLTEENKHLKSLFYQAIGYAHTDACVTLDYGGDPRKTIIGELVARAKTALDFKD